MAEFPLGFLFKEIMVEVHTGTYYAKTSLLNIALIVSYKFILKVSGSKTRQGYSQ
jgi:hypothetical protein